MRGVGAGVGGGNGGAGGGGMGDGGKWRKKLRNEDERGGSEKVKELESMQPGSIAKVN